ncbi:MAG TPA: winged helix-turn-helix transcriptional regulator [Candidatus Aveggerthella stercoripullorum]|uniref:Winged helix-turn-helix transcriptional regulator n=1 Tax=Candidatus Aveggerthella stercoripullorum TaxID=2840688 RepID=A0A9D0ZZ53_9ACTN|nr:winged helix-turn-helix transcriptional regulator [Candidatus Aveggerthella stercoripullorum]
MDSSSVEETDAQAIERLRSEWEALIRRFARGGHEHPLARMGITPLGAQVITTVHALEEAGEIARPNKVARRIGTTPSSLSQTLRALEDKNVLERQRLSGDSRGVSLALTPSGRELAERGKDARESRSRALFEFLGKNDAEELVRIMRRVEEFQRRDREQGANARCLSSVEAPGQEAPSS